MLDLNLVETRFFELKIGNVLYRIEPCSVKTLKQMISLRKDKSEDSFDSFLLIVKKIIDKNINHKSIGMEILENLTMTQINQILSAYMEWMTEVKNDPNL